MSMVQAALPPWPGAAVQRVAAIEQINGKVDALVVDVDLPGDQLSRLVQSYSGIPILLVDWQRSDLTVVTAHNWPIPESNGLATILQTCLRQASTG